MHDLALPIFTLFVQGAIGITLAFCIITQVNGGSISESSNSNRPLFTRHALFTNNMAILFVICGLATLGLLASMTHLGYPINAMYSLMHIQSSWLSREIALSSAFLGLVGCAFLWQLFKGALIKPLLYLAVIFGLIDIYCMASIYQASSVATWDSLHTFTSFYGAMWSIGSLALFAWLNIRATSDNENDANTNKPAPSQSRKQTLKNGVVIGLIISFAIRFYTQLTLIHELPEKVKQLGIMFPSQSQLPFESNLNSLIIMWVVALIGLIALLAYQMTSKRNAQWLGWVAALCLISFECVSRFQFYQIAG